MKICHTAVIALACALSLAGPANAQQEGRYDGADLHGHSISVTVTNNPVSGHLQIASVTVTLPPTECIGNRGIGGDVIQTWTWMPNADIVGSKTTLHYYNGFAVINFQIAFPDATTATGGRGGADAAFETRMRAATKCFAPWEKFTLSYSGPARAPLPTPNAAPLQDAAAKP